MGNQGMTNWKFSVFLVIALTLVAGLFADTALAGNGDGEIDLTLGTLPDGCPASSSSSSTANWRLPLHPRSHRC